jgi:tripartite-type tricarboxylate transporter receptor subunit TctC
VRLVRANTPCFLWLWFLVAQPAHAAEAYPSKPVRVLVGTPPGSGSDVMMRLAAARVGEKWNRSVVIDNRAGALGAIAIDIAAQAAPDGYTLLMLSAQNVAGMVSKPGSIDIAKTFTPVVQMVTLPYLMVVTPSLPVNSVKELIALAKAKPLVYASSGAGSVVHLAMELFKSRAGVQITHIPYKGSGQSMVDVMGGRVQLAITNALTASPLVRTGKLRALAITTALRATAFPDLPSIAEAGLPGFDICSWNGIFAPAKTPDSIIQIINRDVLAVTTTAEMKDKIAADAAEIAPPNTPKEFRALLTREIQMWEKIIRGSGIRIE